MIRARFYIYDDDYRPMKWPIKHPYWCTGQGDGYYIIVAYADSLEELLTNWPDAKEIDTKEETEYSFTSRFPMPEWWIEQNPGKS